ncbi:MAG: FkbM family methyltransferase [Spirochaetaceae bacterium]
MNSRYDDINKNLRYWFDRIIAYLTKSRGRKPILYDVGANEGVFTVNYAERCSRVISFEPTQASYERLTQEIARAASEGRLDPGRVTPVQIGLADIVATMEIHLYSDDSFNSVYERGEEELDHYGLQATGREMITVAPLDRLIEEQQLTPPDFMKIDVEGAELSVLRGAQSTLNDARADESAQGRPFIITEYSVDNTENAGYERELIVAYLEEAGYEVRGLFRNEDTKLYPKDELSDRRIWNLVCIPREESGAFESPASKHRRNP